MCLTTIRKNETGGFLTHSAQEDIIKVAKTSQVGTFQTALQLYAEQNGLQHDAVSGGFVQTGDGNVTSLFPEYQEVRPGLLNSLPMTRAGLLM